MKKLLTTIIVLALLGGGGYAYYVYNKGDDKPIITKATVTRGTIIEQVGATGTLEATRTINIGSQVSGQVKALYVDFNSIVHKGELLAEIDPTILQSAVDQAAANLAKAQVALQQQQIQLAQDQHDLQRNQDLAARKLVTEQALEQAALTVRADNANIDSSKKGLVQLQATLDQANTNLGYAKIYSPIDGVVVQRNADQGQTVNASTVTPNLFLLATDLTTMWIEAGVDESDVGKLHPGQKVTFTVDAYQNLNFSGTVLSVRLNSTTTQNVVTYSTVIEVKNPDLLLRPGMTADVKIEISRADNTLRIPAAALRFRPTNDIYASLHQTPAAPTTGGRGSRGRGQNGADDTGMPAAPGSAPAANAPPAGAAAGAPQANAGGSTGQRQPGQGFGQGQNFGGGGGRGGGGGALARLTPEQRQKMQGMSADDRTKYLASLGIQMPAGGFGRRGGAAANEVQGPIKPLVDRGADTIDQLYEPLNEPVQPASVYVLTGTPELPQLKRVSIRIGITDGQYTQLVSGDLKEGDEVVTTIIPPVSVSSSSSSSSNPLMGPQRGGPGGNRGGGGGFGGRG